MELLCLLNEARWGKGWMSHPMDRKHFEVLTMEEFNREKEEAYRQDQAWLADAEKRFRQQETK